MISVSSHDRNENLPDSPDELDNVSVSPFYERVRGELCVGGQPVWGYVGQLMHECCPPFASLTLQSCCSSSVGHFRKCQAWH